MECHISETSRSQGHSINKPRLVGVNGATFRPLKARTQLFQICRHSFHPDGASPIRALRLHTPDTGGWISLQTTTAGGDPGRRVSKHLLSHALRLHLLLRLDHHWRTSDTACNSTRLPLHWTGLSQLQLVQSDSYDHPDTCGRHAQQLGNAGPSTGPFQSSCRVR